MREIYNTEKRALFFSFSFSFFCFVWYLFGDFVGEIFFNLVEIKKVFNFFIFFLFCTELIEWLYLGFFFCPFFSAEEQFRRLPPYSYVYLSNYIGIQCSTFFFNFYVHSSPPFDWVRTQLIFSNNLKTCK